MGFFIFYLILLSCLITLVARILAWAAYKVSVRRGLPRPKLVQIITFVVSFVLIFIGAFLAIKHHVRLER
ncbi:MAG: hypothetical protein P4L51_17580 [Puia sp.]|nr:hypothetical protein [Puia sp.]